MNGRYILVNGKPVSEPDLIKWAKWIENGDRIVEQTQVAGTQVSTVFLGLDHDFSGAGPPVLWETMVFGGPLDEEQRRYTTLGDAKEGHALLVAAVAAAVALAEPEPTP